MSWANARLVVPARTAAASRLLMRFMRSPRFAKDQIIQTQVAKLDLRFGAAADDPAPDSKPRGAGARGFGVTSRGWSVTASERLPVPRATKIVATLRPPCSHPAVLHRMLAAGVDVVRLNFSHGTADDHVGRARMVREAAHKLGTEIAIMADLQGPKIRVGKFAEGKVTLEPGQQF